jgi:hypothetical protein
VDVAVLIVLIVLVLSFAPGHGLGGWTLALVSAVLVGVVMGIVGRRYPSIYGQRRTPQTAPTQVGAEIGGWVDVLTPTQTFATRRLLGKPAVAVSGPLAGRDRGVHDVRIHRVLLDAHTVVLRDFVGCEADPVGPG